MWNHGRDLNQYMAKHVVSFAQEVSGVTSKSGAVIQTRNKNMEIFD